MKPKSTGKNIKMTTAIAIRNILPGDDHALATIIRKSLEEFGAAKPGTVYFDPTTDHLFEVFKKTGSAYFVIHNEREVLGGGGFYPTANLPAETCELVKLYIAPSARGQGLGKLLMQKCETSASAAGYRFMYLETMPELKIAVPLYKKMGYHYLEAPLGNSGHGGCDIWMGKQLTGEGEVNGQ